MSVAELIMKQKIIVKNLTIENRINYLSLPFDPDKDISLVEKEEMINDLNENNNTPYVRFTSFAANLKLLFPKDTLRILSCDAYWSRAKNVALRPGSDMHTNKPTINEFLATDLAGIKLGSPERFKEFKKLANRHEKRLCEKYFSNLEYVPESALHLARRLSILYPKFNESGVREKIWKTCGDKIISSIKTNSNINFSNLC